MPSSIWSSFASAGQWLRSRPVLHWPVLLVVPGGAYATGQMLLADEPLLRALLLGAAFGVPLATLTLLVRRRYGSGT